MVDGWRPPARVSTLVVLIIIAGCLSGGEPAETKEVSNQIEVKTLTSEGMETSSNTQHPQTATPINSKHPKMDAILYELSVANNTTAYATEHGVPLDNGSVEVVVTLKPNRTFPSEVAATVVVANGNMIRAKIGVTELNSLASHRNVSYVGRPPAADRQVS